VVVVGLTPGYISALLTVPITTHLLVGPALSVFVALSLLN
jgi:hypothetical protein